MKWTRRSSTFFGSGGRLVHQGAMPCSLTDEKTSRHSVIEEIKTSFKKVPGNIWMLWCMTKWLKSIKSFAENLKKKAQMSKEGTTVSTLRICWFRRTTLGSDAIRTVTFGPHFTQTISDWMLSKLSGFFLWHSQIPPVLLLSNLIPTMHLILKNRKRCSGPFTNTCKFTVAN